MVTTKKNKASTKVPSTNVNWEIVAGINVAWTSIAWTNLNVNVTVICLKANHQLNLKNQFTNSCVDRWGC